MNHLGILRPESRRQRTDHGHFPARYLANFDIESLGFGYDNSESRQTMRVLARRPVTGIR